LPFLKAKAISAGQGFGMAVTLDGRAVAWGNNGVML
jgi:alpha-tubulin suppressor-like RCC1 family protein